MLILPLMEERYLVGNWERWAIASKGHIANSTFVHSLRFLGVSYERFHYTQEISFLLYHKGLLILYLQFLKQDSQKNTPRILSDSRGDTRYLLGWRRNLPFWNSREY